MNKDDFDTIFARIMASCLETDISVADVDVIQRVPTRKPCPPNVIIKFVFKCKRDQFLQSAKKHRLNARALCFDTSEPVFVNEHLCPKNKGLLGQAIQAKRETKTEICLGI